MLSILPEVFRVKEDFISAGVGKLPEDSIGSSFILKYSYDIIEQVAYGVTIDNQLSITLKNRSDSRIQTEDDI